VGQQGSIITVYFFVPNVIKIISRHESFFKNRGRERTLCMVRPTFCMVWLSSCAVWPAIWAMCLTFCMSNTHFLKILCFGVFKVCIHGIKNENEIYIKPALIWIPLNLVVVISCIIPLAIFIGINGVLAALIVLAVEIGVQLSFLCILYKFRKEIM